STGEQQRVAVARALANAPEVLLADEPTASVDPETREVVLSRLLREVHISKKVLLVATHDRSLLTRFDRVVHSDQPDLPATTPGSPMPCLWPWAIAPMARRSLGSVRSCLGSLIRRPANPTLPWPRAASRCTPSKPLLAPRLPGTGNSATRFRVTTGVSRRR